MTTKESIAESLNGVQLDSFTDHLRRLAPRAKEAGIVIVYGASDDLMEFEGAIYDEAGVYGGGDVHLDRRGVLDRDQCDGDDEIADFVIRQRASRKITAHWCATTDCDWTFETDIPHATFEVQLDGKLHQRGIVFAIADLPEPAK